MGLVTLVGFDHCSLSSPTAASLAAAVPRLSPNVTFMSQMSSPNQATLTDLPGSAAGTTRRYLSGISASPHYLNAQFPVVSFARTGKWYMGIRVRPSGAAPSASSPVLYFGFGGTTVTNAVVIPAVIATYYVEIEIDWGNLICNCYLNGELQNTYSGGSYFPATPALATIRIGGYTSMPTNGVWNLTDFYFANDVANDPAPVGARLGQIMVKPQLISTVDNATLFASQNSGVAVVDALNAPFTGGVNVNGVNTDPRGALAQLNYAAPAETNAIKGVHVFANAWRDPTASAGLHLDVTQGAQVQTKTAIPVVTGTAVLVPLDFPMALDLNGAAWTPASIAALKVHIGSYRP